MPAGPPPTIAIFLPVSAFGSTGSRSSPDCSASLVWSAMKRWLHDMEPDFILRGGCTLLVDLETARVRYCIYKDLSSQNRMERMRRYLQEGPGSSLRATYLGDPGREYFQNSGKHGLRLEPLASLHLLPREDM